MKTSLSKEQLIILFKRGSKLLLIAIILFFIIVPASRFEVVTDFVDRHRLMAEASEYSEGSLEDELKQVMFQEKKVEHESLRGIYITANMAASKHFQPLVDALIESGGNFIVMDIEISGGQLAFVPEDPWLTTKNPGSTILSDLKSIIQDLHRRDIYVVARQVVFNDPYAGQRFPEWRIKYKNWDGLFDYRWLDASNPEVQAYNLAITKEVAKLGFDEIQYDYIRFPDEYRNNLEFYYDETQMEAWEVINNFLAEAHKVTREYDIKLGMDVFGAAIWGNVDWQIVGQNIPEVAKNVDVIYPMTYPSHVSPGYYGFENPWGDPGSFVRESIKKFREAADGNAEIRTWIQGFPLHAPNFGDWYMQEQVKGTYEAGADDWVIWSPGNKYGYSWSSMRMLPPAPILEGEPDPEEPETE